MSQGILQVVVRDNVSKSNNKKLRKEGYLLGNISRKGLDSVAIAVKADQFRKAIKQYGKNAVLKLQTQDNDNYNVVVKDSQVAFKDFQFLHIDFQQISLTEEIKLDVAIKFIGQEFLESKRLLLNRLMDAIPVSGLPQNIPDEIEVDLTNVSAGDSIYIRDIQFPDGITPDVEGEQMLASISEIKVQVAEEETEENQAEE
ncbi:MAG: 50S ribosomal protein L25 [Clostridiales bacterium]|nr:50S ribosomal protein L25 [Clostridiales bacterium]